MKTVVYTCITGGYDCLKEVPEQFREGLDFVCYTDDPNLKSETWTMRMIPKELSKLTKVKQQRIIKICASKFFPEYDASLWIDGSMEIIGNIVDILKQCDLKKYPLWTLKHPSRICIYEEEKIVLKMKKDIPSITAPQMKRYLNEGYPRNYGLIESRILYRRHNDELCKKTMFLWANELLKGSHRDQLSFNYCSWKTGLKYGIINKNLIKKTFKWFSKHPKNEKYLNKNIIVKETSMNLNDVDIYTVNFNHSELTNILIKSILKNVSGINYRIFVIDNSDKMPFVLDNSIDKSLVTIIDNTDDKVIPIKFAAKYFPDKTISTPNNNGSFKHCLTIQWIIDNCEKDNLIIFDCDTILKKNIDFLDTKYISIASIDNRIKFKKRLHPCFQYFNISSIRKLNIKYFDPARINGGTTKDGFYYDTGASFFEDIEKQHLPYKVLSNLDQYVSHLRAATYSPQNIEKFFKINEKYWKDDFVKSNNDEVIISLTTWKNRLQRGNLQKVLSSIIGQKTDKKIKIVLTLFKDDIQYISKDLQDFLNKYNIEILQADKNLRPHLKYFYAMQKYKYNSIITIDDDCIYDNALVSDLYNSYQKYPNSISARRVHEITYDNNGKTKPYKQWIYEIKTKTGPSNSLFATGVAGVLYPPNILQLSDNDLEKIKISITNDDLFLKKKEQELGIQTVYVPSKNGKYGYISLPESLGKEALAVSCNDINNDIIIKNLNL